MSYYIYILLCSNNSYYTGYTTDIERRYQEHRKGTSKCKYTRSFPPIKIAAYWEIEAELSIILKIERKIKSLKRSDKEKLINNKELLESIIQNSTT